jgi:hypothetical protein
VDTLISEAPQHIEVHDDPKPTPPEPGFNSPIVIKDGVIMVSIRFTSCLAALLFTGCLLVMGYKACSDGLVECEGDKWPMISSIICLNLYSRFAALLFTFVMISVNQVGYRANFAKLYGIVPNATNDYLLVLGIISCISVPAITYFDEHNYKVAHGIIAAAAFFSGAFYADKISSVMVANKDKFDTLTQNEIAFCRKQAIALNATLWSFVAAMVIYGSGTAQVAFLEWALAFQTFNYFAIQSFTNSFYQTVHPYAKLTLFSL